VASRCDRPACRPSIARQKSVLTWHSFCLHNNSEQLSFRTLTLLNELRVQALPCLCAPDAFKT